MSRLNEQQVNQQLNDELLSFYNTLYTRPVPKGFVQLFKDAVFHSAPISHQIFIVKVRAIISRKESELLTGEIGMMTNAINGVSMNRLYENFELALDTHEQIEQLTRDYNSDVMAFKQSLEKKRNTLMQLISPNNRNGLKIIPSAQA